MINLKSGRTAAVDCDETLLSWNPDKFKHNPKDLIEMEDPITGHKKQFLPHFHNIELLKNLKLQGYTIIVWSAASGNWACKVVNALNLEKFVDLTCDKLELAVDDLLDAKKIIKTIIWIDPISGEYKRNE